MVERSQLIYLTLSGLIAVILLLWLKISLTKFENKRKNRIIKLKRFNTIFTKLSSKNLLANSKKKALNNLTIRFTIIRRVVFILFISIWSLVLVLPILGRIPAVYISLIVASITVIIGFAAKPLI